MAFPRRRNGSSPIDDPPTVVVETPAPDAYARYASRRQERVRGAEEKFSEKIGTRLYDPDDKDAFNGQIDAETAKWSDEDVATHRKYREELDDRLAKADGEVTRTREQLADAEKQLRTAEQRVAYAAEQLGEQPVPPATVNGPAQMSGAADPREQANGAASEGAEPGQENPSGDLGQRQRTSPAPDPTADTVPPAAAKRSMGRYSDRVALHRKSDPWWHWLLVALAVGGDIAAFYVVLERLFRSYPLIISLAVLAFAATAVLLSHVTGRAWRRRVAREPDRSDTLLWVPLASWIPLGGAAAAGRLFFGDLSAPATTFGSPAAAGGGDQLAILPAVIFLALYIGSGICAMYASYEAYNPAATAYRLAVPQCDKAQGEKERCAGTYSEAETRKAQIEKVIARAPKRLERAQLVTFNEIVGLKHFVRHRMAGNTDSPRGLNLFMQDAPEPKELPAEEDE